MLLEVEQLDVRVPVSGGILHPVCGVSLSVGRGDMLCIVGESGCGKSLTSLALMNLLPARAQRSAQKLVYDGIDLLRLDERAMSDLRGNAMAMIFQEPMTSLNPCYTIGTQLTETLRRHRRVTQRAARERAVELLEKVGITGAADRLSQYPHQLSGGLRQRVMMAMALMCGPKLLIADEPTTALDVTVQAQILHLLASLRRELHMAVILITHDLGIVARVGTHAAVMYAGEIVETGTAAEVFARPTHPYTQGLLLRICGMREHARYARRNLSGPLLSLPVVTRAPVRDRARGADRHIEHPQPEDGVETPHTRVRWKSGVGGGPQTLV